MKVLYTAKATVRGGRNGHARTSDGQLDVDIVPPAELGGSGEGTNPEQLFATGYGACFQSAMAVVGRRMKIDTSNSTVESQVDLGALEGGMFGLHVELHVDLPDLDPEQAREVVRKAHRVCPYSNATRGNIEVDLHVGGERLELAAA
jgi:osmotically inducible protein OsmC